MIRVLLLIGAITATTTASAQDTLTGQVTVPTIGDYSDPAPTSRGTGVRTWQIHLQTGSIIEFQAAWNWVNSSGPANFLMDYNRFLFDGKKPNWPKRYAFPTNNNNGDRSQAANVIIDLGQIVSVVQKF